MVTTGSARVPLRGGARGSAPWIALAVLAGLAPACGHEDWGGPKGPPPAPAEAAPSAPLTTPQAFAAMEANAAAGASAGPVARDGRDGGAPSLVAHVDGQLSGGKVPGFDDVIAGMRGALKACVDGHGDLDAVIELSAPIDPKGRVGHVDALGGSQFGPGVVGCLERRVAGASFNKPASGSPRFMIRVKLRRD